MKRSIDVATVVGFVVAIFFVLLGMGSNVPAFINIPSFLIVVGGTIGSMIISYPLKTTLEVFSVLKNVFFSEKIDNSKTITMIIDLAQRARREGILSLETQAQEIDDPFIKTGIQMAVDGVEPERLKSVLSVEIAYLDERHRLGIEYWEHVAAIAPAYGMVGTLVGLIIMLLQMDDPSSIGPAMAVALVTTFYGSLIANMVCLPIAKKLLIYSEKEILSRSLALAGIISIQEGENPRLVEQKLNAFIGPSERVSIIDQKK